MLEIQYNIFHNNDINITPIIYVKIYFQIVRKLVSIDLLCNSNNSIVIVRIIRI